MHHLPEPMHARVRAARDDRLQRRLREFAQCALEFVLHCLAVRLRLPAAKRGAVVLNAQCDARRSCVHHDKGASVDSIARASLRVAASLDSMTSLINVRAPATSPSSMYSAASSSLLRAMRASSSGVKVGSGWAGPGGNSRSKSSASGPYFAAPMPAVAPWPAVR